MSASFGQVSLTPALVVVNPNRMHSIEPAIAHSQRFAINVMPASSQLLVTRLMKMRRREPNKAEALGLRLSEDKHQIPFIDGSLRILFCEVVQTIPSGDRRLYIARVLESRVGQASERPLLFSDVKGIGAKPALWRSIRSLLVVTGLLDFAKTFRQRLRPQPPANIAKTTYDEAGATEEEIAKILSFDVIDDGRRIRPPNAPAIIKKKIGICVVGTGWGSTHCRYLKMANPALRLFVCGRNQEKTAQLARSFRADGFFNDLRSAAEDSRVQALTLALPHDIHREAAQVAAEAGKHVLVEKPIATNLEDADAMIAFARRSNTILMVAEDMHFRPAVREAVRCIMRGDIGEPLYLLVHAGGVRQPRGWAAEKERMGGGVLIDIGVHYIRGLRLIMGEPNTVLACRAMQMNTKMDGEDSVQLIFQSRYGWSSQMLLTWSTLRGNLPDLVVAGDRGTLHIWPGRHHLDYYCVEPSVLTQAISYVRPYWLQEKLLRPGMQRVKLPLKDRDITGYLGEMKEFIATIAEERDPASPPEDARRDLEIILHSYQALSRGVRVDIPTPGPKKRHLDN